MPQKRKNKNLPPKNQVKHDQSYKRLFSHPKMVEDLLRGFVHEAWVNELDFSTLEIFKDSFVSDDLRDRHDDIIWRVRWGEKWLYVYLLLEFQSSVDNFMAVRMMVYLGLLYQYLIDSQFNWANTQVRPYTGTVGANLRVRPFERSARGIRKIPSPITLFFD